MIFFTVLKTLWRLLSPRRKRVFLALTTLLFISGLFEMGSMLMIFGYIKGLSVEANGERAGQLARLMNLLSEGPISQINYVVLGGVSVFVFIIGKNALSMLVHFGMIRFLMKLNHRISKYLLDSHLVLPLETLNQMGVNTVQKRVANLYAIFSKCFFAVAQTLADSSTLIMVIILLIFVDPVLTLSAAVLFGGFGLLTYQVMQAQLRRIGALKDKAESRSSRFLTEALHGFIDTRLRGTSRYYSEEYSKALGQQSLHKRRSMGFRKFPRAANEIILTMMIVVSVFYITFSGSSVDAALPTLAIFGFAGLRMTGAMSRVNTSFQQLRENYAQFESLEKMVRKYVPQVYQDDAEADFLDYRADEVDFPEGKDGRLKKVISAKGLGFRYPKKKDWALKNISLEIHRGEHTAFCGKSGGGKSTLALLLMGLMRPSKGTITCDDWNIHQHISAWHENIGFVPQSPWLSAGTVKDNVALGEAESEISDERVISALKLASAWEFVNKLPHKLETPLKGGSVLSGGQCQRIAIARALYRDPEVLVFDEATAALDNETERAISQAITELSKEKTVISIAHRLSTIEAADRIYLIEDGQVTASGKYESLLNESPAFKRLAQGVEEG